MPFVPLAFSPRRARRHGRLAAASVLFVVMAIAELASGRPRDFHDDWIVPIHAATGRAPSPLREGDRDADGLSDTLEAELARTYAPVVVLDPRDTARPASISWIMARASFSGGFDEETRKGSSRPEDWETYVDVYPRVDGGMHIEYWFYYPYNDGPGFFDHESDWEHVTVRLDEHGEPLGAYLARHEDNAPGPYFEWSRLRKEGSHPIVLSAQGTHATYADAKDLGWFEAAVVCPEPGSCGERLWRTWEGGGIRRIDEASDAPELARAFGFSGRWGAEGSLPGTSAPRGPTFQAGHCAWGFSSCRQRSNQIARM